MNALTPITKARRPAAWRQFHAVADKHLARLTRAIIQVFDEQQALVNMKALTAAIRIGSLPDAMAALNLPDDTIAKADEWRDFKGVLRGLWQGGFELTEGSFDRQTGITARFDMELPRAVQHLNEYQFELIQGIDAATKTLLQDILGMAFTNPVGAELIGIPAGNPRQTARTIQQFIGITENQASTLDNFVEKLRENGADEDLIAKRRELYLKRMRRSRATTIARTETIRAVSVGQQELWRQAADQGFIDANVARRIWFVTPDDRLCQLCRPVPGMNPKGVALDQPFATPVGPVMFPPLHQNCLTGDALITAGSHVSAVSKRVYRGEIIIIGTASGNHLTITANHPILTDAGWSPAEEIRKGDHVMSRLGGERKQTLVANDKYDMPTSIEEITKTVLMSGGMDTGVMEVPGPDFYDDGIGSHIGVIGTDSELRGGVETQSIKQIEQLPFCRVHRHKFLATLRSGMQMLGRLFFPPNCVMSGTDLAFAGQWTHSGPFDGFGFTMPPQGNPGVFKGATESLSRYADFARDIIDGSSGPVFSDKVLDIRRAPFSGHVHNLQTGQRHYTANGIIVHNCRCAISIIPQGETAVPELQKLPPLKPTPRGRSLRPSLSPGRKKVIRKHDPRIEKTNQKKQARKVVEVALRNGSLKRGACIGCGTKKNVHAHHDDYSKPLKIKWMCPSCHGAYHSKK